MNELFAAGRLQLDALPNERVQRVIDAATERAAPHARSSDVIAAAIQSGDSQVLTILAQTLQPGVVPRQVVELIDIYRAPRSHGGSSTFGGTRAEFAPPLLDALDEFEIELDAALTAHGEGVWNAALELLLACVLQHLDADDQENLGKVWEVARAAKLFRAQFDCAQATPEALFDSTTQRLRADAFDEAGWATLEQAAERAGELGYERLLPPHLFIALLSETEGITEQLVRRQTKPGVGIAHVLDTINTAFRLTDRKREPAPLLGDQLGEATVDLLHRAQGLCCLWNVELIDPALILLALLMAPPPRLVSVLQAPPLDLDLDKLRAQLEQELREARISNKREIAFRLPAPILPSEDLTYRARTQALEPALYVESYLDMMARALYRRSNRHVLLTGLRGVGKTTVVNELARRAAAGEIPFLKRKRFLWIDCRHVAPHESRKKMDALLSHIQGRTDLIVCLDDAGPLLRADPGGNNKLTLLAALQESTCQFILILSDWDFQDLVSNDYQLLECFTRLEIGEPKREHALEMAAQAAANLAQEYKLKLEERAVARAVILSADYILNERLPTKAIKILRRVCEEVDFARTQRADSNATVGVAHVVRVVAESSGVPEETLAGWSGDANYERDLGQLVVGQKEAVRIVAEQLTRIKAGLNEPGKPASVMLFAGLTGVGKTELAKTLARFYSASKKLQTYTMENFGEAHSVAGIIGSPPGYVGYEQGGRLINDLNADPYCVFLLDEAEKAHPEVWKPFLNLFDEGWIVDQRGVKAFADRAIFILTSNAGRETIARLSAQGKSEQEIEQAVREHLRTVRHPQSNQLTFTPEFLARLKRVIVFQPLSSAAMLEITRQLVKRMQTTWLDKREKHIVVPESLIQHIAAYSHHRDVQTQHSEGGRIVRRKIEEWIETAIQSAGAAQPVEYRDCAVIELHFTRPLNPDAEKIEIAVEFRHEQEPTPKEMVARAVAKLEYALGTGANAAQLESIAAAALARARFQVERAREASPNALHSRQGEMLLEQFEATQRALAQLNQATDQHAQLVTRDLIDALTAEGAPV